jgi:hypothetical protein
VSGGQADQAAVATSSVAELALVNTGRAPAPSRQEFHPVGEASAMTRSWLVSAATGRSPGDHVCWPFRHHQELVGQVRGYVAEGLARNERVVGYLAEENLSDLRDQLAGHDRLRTAIDGAQLQLLPVDAIAASGRDPEHEVASWAGLLRESLDAGFTGLRAFRDMTRRVTNPGQRADHVRFEHLADRFCLGHPYTALCAYNRRELGDAAVAELACVHRLIRDRLSPFQLHASTRADVALAGSVDTLSAAQLMQALQRIGIPRARQRAVIDAGDLEFIDHRALVTLDRYAVTRQATVVLRSPPDIVPRLLDLIPLHAVRWEESR